MIQNATHSAPRTASPDGHPSQEPVEKRIPLAQLRRGQVATICDAEIAREDADLLRAMGLRPSARIRLCRPGQPCIVSVLGAHGACCRIGLSRPLAERVMVGVGS